METIDGKNMSYYNGLGNLVFFGESRREKSCFLLSDSCALTSILVLCKEILFS
jgi:hypothetical protein